MGRSLPELCLAKKAFRAVALLTMTQEATPQVAMPVFRLW
jgi:hypothetical protein